MLPGQFFFEVPIYDRPKSQHNAEQAAKRQKRMEVVAAGGEDLAQAAGDDFDAFEAFPWDFNCLFGFVGLHAGRSTIKGELFRRGHSFAAGSFPVASPSRRRLLRRRQIFAAGNVLEIWSPRDATNEEILARLIHELKNLRRHSSLTRSRVVDTRAIEILGPFINWRGLIKLDG